MPVLSVKKSKKRAASSAVHLHEKRAIFSDQASPLVLPLIFWSKPSPWCLRAKSIKTEAAVFFLRSPASVQVRQSWPRFEPIQTATRKETAKKISWPNLLIQLYKKVLLILHRVQNESRRGCKKYQHFLGRRPWRIFMEEILDGKGLQSNVLFHTVLKAKKD